MTTQIQAMESSMITVDDVNRVLARIRSELDLTEGVYRTPDEIRDDVIRSEATALGLVGRGILGTLVEILGTHPYAQGSDSVERRRILREMRTKPLLSYPEWFRGMIPDLLAAIEDPTVASYLDGLEAWQ